MSSSFLGELRDDFSAVFVAVGGIIAHVMKMRLYFC